MIIRFLVTSLDKALLHQLLSLAGRPALRRVLVVPNFFHLRFVEAAVLLGTFSAAEMFLQPSLDLCINTILYPSTAGSTLDLLAWFSLRYALSAVSPFVERRVPFQIMSTQFNLPQVDSNQGVETSLQ